MRKRKGWQRQAGTLVRTHQAQQFLGENFSFDGLPGIKTMLRYFGH
jgi:hypothetical protein